MSSDNHSLTVDKMTIISIIKEYIQKDEFI